MTEANTSSRRRDRRVFALEDGEIALEIRRDRRARRMNLRLDAGGEAVILTLPAHAADTDGLDFVSQHADWIAAKLASQMPRRLFTAGTVIPYRGIGHRIRHRPDARGGAWLEAGEIHVAGRPEHLSRRVRDWLRAEARRELCVLARDKTAVIDRRVARVTVRDTISRWGSCTADGRLSFSWRLILAPDHVLDYLVAHEVAHLIELNHGPRFHALVARLTRDAPAAEAWLRRHGPDLHRYG